MNILGVDPSLSNTGYGMLKFKKNQYFPIEGGVIKTKSTDSLEKRLSIIFDEFSSIVKKYIPDAIAVEDLHSRPKFAKTSILMGHARSNFIYSRIAQYKGI